MQPSDLSTALPLLDGLFRRACAACVRMPERGLAAFTQRPWIAQRFTAGDFERAGVGMEARAI
jgi:hypothetical protein